MIASWMAYALLVSVLVSVAATVFEHVAAARRLPSRFVWFAALVLSIAWPVGSAVRRLAPRPVEPVTLLPFVITLPPMVINGTDAADRAALVDRALVVLWCSLSGLLVLRLGRGVVVLARTRRDWTRRDVDGTDVQLSSNIGPAVVGLRSMDVVLPEWILSLDAPLRAIVLKHEEEHRSARDPYLLFIAAVAVALMPWNIALWLQARRLRLAIEMDCDARVLRAHPSAERYGLLMLTIAQRRSAVPSHFAPMLSEPTTQLERRILAMRTTTHRLARLTVYGGTVIAMGVLAFACSLQSDTPTGPKPSASKSPTAVNDKQTYFEFQVEKPVAPVNGNPSPRYPDALRTANIEGDVIAQFVADTLGHPDMGTFKVLKSSDPLFTEAVRSSLPNMRFSPALVGNRPVKQLVQMPFMFTLSGVSRASGTLSAGDTLRSSASGVNVLRAVHVDAAARQGVGAASAAAAHPGVYLEYQVAKAVSPRGSNPGPRYPDALRAANVAGEVLAEFVVNEDGMADTSTFRVLKSTDEQFTAAVRTSLSKFQFSPAELPSGQRVKQLVQMPFQFSLTKH